MGIKHTTSSFQAVLADLRTTRISNGLPSPTEILQGRNLVTKAQADVDIKAIRSLLQERQLKMTLAHNQSKRAKRVRPLMVGERCYFLGPNNRWIDAFVVGVTDSGRSYDTWVEVTGDSLMRNYSHIRPKSPDIPMMYDSFLWKTQSLQHHAIRIHHLPAKNSVLKGVHLNKQLANCNVTAGPKTVLSEPCMKVKQTNTSQVLVSETVPPLRVQPSR